MLLAATFDTKDSLAVKRSSRLWYRLHVSERVDPWEKGSNGTTCLQLVTVNPYCGVPSMLLFTSNLFLATMLSSPASLLRSCTTRSSSQSCLPWNHLTVEWSPRVAKLQTETTILETATHFVFPDLPAVYTSEHRAIYLKSTPPEKRIQTLAVCRHETWQSIVKTAKRRLGITAEDISTSGPQGALLIVGGNDKNSSTISTEEAVTIIRSELGAHVELWAVADPNDPTSPRRVETKAASGVHGFFTQPLLTSTAWDTLNSFETRNASLVVGVACPRSAKNLQFWRQLLDRPELLDNDPLFLSHLAYFSQPYVTSLAWIGRELQQCFTQSTTDGARPTVDGLHFMPLRNMDDLATVFGTLRVNQQRRAADRIVSK
jgi:hypothetical protein